MSKRAYQVSDVASDDEDNLYEDDEAYEEEAVAEAYADADDDAGYDYEAPEQKTGLFSSPARAITLVFSILLLFTVVGLMAWLLGQSGKTTIKTIPPVVGSLTPVPDVNNANSPYTSKPNGLVEAPRIGALPPNFEWVDSKTGKPRSLESLRGKPVLLNFWGTWCPPCRAEMPAMQEIYDRIQNDVVFLGVSMGPRDAPLNVSQFVQLGKYTWDFVHDPDSEVMARYQVTGLPSSYFIDKNGVIKAIHVGGADSRILEENLEKAQQ